MCLHCRTKKECISLNYVLNSTSTSKACGRASDSLRISKDILQAQRDEVKEIVRRLREADGKARRGYRLFTAYDKSIRGESLATIVNNDRGVTREQREANRATGALPEARRKHVFNLIDSNPGLQSLDTNLTDLHLKQIEFYDKIAKDLERLTITREDRAEEASHRSARQAESAELREKLKENVVKRAPVPEESNALKAEKRALRKEQALAKKQREQEAKAEIKLNQAKLQSSTQ